MHCNCQFIITALLCVSDAEIRHICFFNTYLCCFFVVFVSADEQRDQTQKETGRLSAASQEHLSQGQKLLHMNLFDAPHAGEDGLNQERQVE